VNINEARNCMGAKYSDVSNVCCNPMIPVQLHRRAACRPHRNQA
jgi:hypothetical protein